MIYLDEEYRAHAEQNEAGTLTPWEDADGFFTGKCDAYIEGYRVVPDGETWIRVDGKVFTGLMISPAVNPAQLQSVQAEYDKQTINELAAVKAEIAEKKEKKNKAKSDYAKLKTDAERIAFIAEYFELTEV